MINEWVNTATQKKCKTNGEYPTETSNKGRISPYWIAVVPFQRLVKEGYSYYEVDSDWAKDANEQIRQFVEGKK